MWGTIAVGLFASENCLNTGEDAVLGIFYSRKGSRSWDFLGWQILGLSFYCLWSFMVCMCCLLVFNVFIPLRSDLLTEIYGPTRAHEIRNVPYY